MRKHHSRRAVVSAAVAAAVSCLSGPAARAANMPIALAPGSFNYNTVVTAGTPGSSATIVGGTPAAVDTENGLTYWGPSFNASGALPAPGTPFTSSGNSSTQFQLASFTANNTLLINADQEYSGGSPPFFAPPYTQTGSLSLAKPAAYTTLAILYSAAGQNYYSSMPAIDYTLSFADGTTYNNSGAAAFQAYGWDDTSGTVAAAGYRVWVNQTNGKSGQTFGVNWYLHEADITIPSADVNEPLTGISFYDSGSGYYGSANMNTTDPNSFDVYALSGAVTQAVPEPVSAGLLAVAAAAMAFRRRGPAGPAKRPVG